MSVTRILCPNGCGLPIAFCVCQRQPADALDPVSLIPHAGEGMVKAMQRAYAQGVAAERARLRGLVEGERRGHEPWCAALEPTIGLPEHCSCDLALDEWNAAIARILTKHLGAPQ